mmetsp:Transcript_36574/g.84087  ORF Transcript_36574/g.84087 Transcript_36574/m.84087 type:complete len:215 (+) Transcript_36574:862-1506(+)
MFTRIHFCCSLPLAMTSYHGLFSLNGGAANNWFSAASFGCSSLPSPVPPVACSSSQRIRLSIASESASICCCRRHRSTSGDMIWSSYARIGARTSSPSPMAVSPSNGPVSIPAAAAAAATSAATSESRMPPDCIGCGCCCATGACGGDICRPGAALPYSRKRFTASSKLPLAISRKEVASSVLAQLVSAINVVTSSSATIAAAIPKLPPEKWEP